MRKGQGIAGPPPQVGPMTARQQQRQKYVQNHPQAGQRQAPQPPQGPGPGMQRVSPGVYRPAPQQQPQRMDPMQQMKQPGGMALQPMPQGVNPGQAIPMPRGGQGFGLGANGFDPNAGWQNPYQGGTPGQQFGGQFHDMMYRYPQGQGPNMQQMQGGIQNLMYTSGPQQYGRMQALQNQQQNQQQMSPEQMQQMYNQKVGSRGGY